MKKAIHYLFVALALAGAAPAAASQQSTTTPAPAVVRAQEDADADAAFPVRDTAPRLQRAYLHVFLAFGIAWVLIFGYAVTLGKRFNRLEQDLERFNRPR